MGENHGSTHTPNRITIDIRVFTRTQKKGGDTTLTSVFVTRDGFTTEQQETKIAHSTIVTLFFFNTITY